MRIAVYSGSFNPIHLGHSCLAESLVDGKIVDEVWFVVSPCNPLKDQSGLIDENLRLQMVKLAVKHKKGMLASDVEFDMPVPSYSVDTLQKLSLLYPQHQFSLIIGSDNALVFDQWKDYAAILGHYPVLVYPRKGYDAAPVLDRFPGMQMLNTPYYDISSTEIRELLKTGGDAAAWLAPSVLTFIREKHLYLS